MSKHRRAIPTGYRAYTTRHLRADLWERLAHRAVKRRVSVEVVLNEALAAGLDALGEPGVNPHRREVRA